MKSLLTSLISVPAAHNKIFAIIPEVITVSAVPFLNTFSITIMESSAFIPPRTNTHGFLTLSNASVSIFNSFSITLPAAEGTFLVNPTSETCDLCAAANASFINKSISGDNSFTIIDFDCSSGVL